MGQESISSVLGPMSTSISALKLFTKAIIDARPWDHDPLAIRKAWSDEEYRLVEHGGGKALCFAILWDNNVVKLHPPLIRAMNIVKMCWRGKDTRVSCFHLLSLTCRVSLFP